MTAKLFARSSCSYCPAIRSSSNYGLSNTRPGSRSCTVLLAAASRSHRWVTNLGYLRAVALWKQYRPAGVALALSVWLEPMFNFALEAMAFGLPVISRRTSIPPAAVAWRGANVSGHGPLLKRAIPASAGTQGGDYDWLRVVAITRLGSESAHG